MKRSWECCPRKSHQAAPNYKSQSSSPPCASAAKILGKTEDHSPSQCLASLIMLRNNPKEFFFLLLSYITSQTLFHLPPLLPYPNFLLLKIHSSSASLQKKENLLEISNELNIRIQGARGFKDSSRTWPTEST